MAEITITGIEELIKRLGMARATDVLHPPMVRSTARLVNFMARYPPQPRSTYRRTGTLGRRWTMVVTVTSDGIRGVVGNNTSYGPFVQSEQFQARALAHWQTDADALGELERPIIADFEEAIQTALSG